MSKTDFASVLIRSPLRFSFALVQLIILCWLVNRYSVEASLGLPSFLPLVLAGFFFHALLPRRLQLSFFIGWSLLVAFWLFGWLPALIFFGLFSVLFGILQLPLSVNLRAALLAVAGFALAWIWTATDIPIPADHQIIPVIGSVFMFRASVYLYDVKHEKVPTSFEQRLAYFLMLPNLVFTLFPVVDYKIFRRSYFLRQPIDIYQKGVRLLIRGFFHLMLYRIIYYYIQPTPEQVSGLLSFALFALTSYLLILRLSGLFHFAVGILCLFGFDLPRVFHNYFLASGFSDLWRRINVYWRDYIMKVFYYPIYFKLRKLGKNTGMVLAILIVFSITWLLHSYQWFWIKGSFPLRLVDIIFWGLFGVLVAGNALIQQARARIKRSAGNGIRAHLVHALQVMAMLSFMSLLWTFWNSPTVAEWSHQVTVVTNAGKQEWILLLGIIAAGVGLLAAGFRAFEHPKIKALLEPDDASPRAAVWGSLTLVIFLLLSLPPVIGLFRGIAPRPVEHVYEMRLTETDDARRVKGYYEDILISSNALAPLADEVQGPIVGANFAKSKAALPTDDWRRLEFAPSIRTTFKGAELRINKWGMRDEECTREKPPGTFRVALLGGSYVMGSGVAQDQVIDAQCERILNQQDKPFFELLNFSVPGYYLLHSVWQFDHVALDFSPDVVMLFSHGLDFVKTLETVNESYMSGRLIQMPYIRRVSDAAGYRERHIPDLSGSAFDSLSVQIVEASLRHVADSCRNAGILPVFVLWPRTNPAQHPPQTDYLLLLAASCGMEVIDLREVYADYSRDQLAVAVNDGHPNALGHQLIAEALAEYLKDLPGAEKQE